MRSVVAYFVLCMLCGPSGAAEIPEPALYTWGQGGNIDPYAMPLESYSRFRTLADAIIDVKKKFAHNAEAICRTGSTGWELVSFRFEDVYTDGSGNHGGLRSYCTIRSTSTGSVHEAPSITFTFQAHCRPGWSFIDGTVRGHQVCFYPKNDRIEMQDICPLVEGLDIANSGMRYDKHTSEFIGPLVYTSFMATDVGLGAGWSNPWTRRINAELPTVSPYVFAYRSSGQVVAFTYDAGAYVSDSNTELALEIRSDTDGTIKGWRLSRPDGSSETYGREGRLTAVSYPNGNTFTVTRNAEGRILEVSDSTGQRLTFVYEGAHIASITDASGRSAQMHYSAEDDLIAVTAPDGTQRHFHYNERAHTSDAELPHGLTGVTDERGIREATYEYYPDGRAKRSFNDGGVSSRTITYNDELGTRTVTTGNGTSTIYRTSTQNGVRVLTKVEGSCCSP